MTTKKRHRWGVPSRGMVSCRDCGLEVKESDRKRGGLGPCIIGRWKLKVKSPDDIDTLVECPECHKKVPNTITCIFCGGLIHPLGWKREEIE